MSTEHFKGKYEVELKYKLSSKSEFLAQLSNMTYEVMLENNVESDTYFDTPEKNLEAEGKSLCIRSMEPSGIKLWIVKGPEPDRCEATNITDANSALSMLTNLGYQVVLTTQKVRSIYFVGKYHITVDTLEGIGDFAEFAIMTDDEQMLQQYKSELEALADQFGLTVGDIQTKSYRQMIIENRSS